MSIFKIQKFGCTNSIPTEDEINYIINYTSIYDCTAELQIGFDVRYYDNNDKRIKIGVSHETVVINEDDNVKDIMNRIYKFKEEIDKYNSRAIPV